MSLYLESPATGLHVQQYIQANNNTVQGLAINICVYPVAVGSKH